MYGRNAFGFDPNVLRADRGAAPVSWVAREGCTPQLDAHKTGPVEPVGRLSLFHLQRIGATLAGTEAPFDFLVERGNVRALDSGAADLFAVPPGYSQDR